MLLRIFPTDFDTMNAPFSKKSRNIFQVILPVSVELAPTWFQTIAGDGAHNKQHAESDYRLGKLIFVDISIQLASKRGEKLN